MDTFAVDLDWSGLIAHPAVLCLVFARTLGVCATAPLTVIPGMSWRFRLALAVALVVLLAPVVEPRIVVAPEASSLVWLAVMEVLVGGVLGWSAAMIVAGARQAGEIVAAQAGLSAAALLDTDTGEDLTALGHLYGLIALAVFLSLDGPLVMVGSLVESYRSVPAGGLSLSQETVSQAFAQVGDALALALRAAAPPAIGLAIAGVIMGWTGRLAPALPVLTLSLPVRSALGIALVFLCLGVLAATLSHAWASWPRAL
jgi:flagellar biosynthetic protein FliR